MIDNGEMGLGRQISRGQHHCNKHFFQKRATPAYTETQICIRAIDSTAHDIVDRIPYGIQLPLFLFILPPSSRPLPLLIPFRYIRNLKPCTQRTVISSHSHNNPQLRPHIPHTPVWHGIHQKKKKGNANQEANSASAYPPCPSP